MNWRFFLEGWRFQWEKMENDKNSWSLRWNFLKDMKLWRILGGLNKNWSCDWPEQAVGAYKNHVTHISNAIGQNSMVTSAVTNQVQYGRDAWRIDKFLCMILYKTIFMLIFQNAMSCNLKIGGLNWWGLMLTSWNISSKTPTNCTFLCWSLKNLDSNQKLWCVKIFLLVDRRFDAIPTPTPTLELDWIISSFS